MSALCQKRTYTLQQKYRYSITSSARASSVGGTVSPRRGYTGPTRQAVLGGRGTCPALNWAPAGVGIRSTPRRVPRTGAGNISARMPVPYPRSLVITLSNDWACPLSAKSGHSGSVKVELMMTLLVRRAGR